MRSPSRHLRGFLFPRGALLLRALCLSPVAARVPELGKAGSLRPRYTTTPYLRAPVPAADRARATWVFCRDFHFSYDCLEVLEKTTPIFVHPFVYIENRALCPILGGQRQKRKRTVDHRAWPCSSFGRVSPSGCLLTCGLYSCVLLKLIL